MNIGFFGGARNGRYRGGESAHATIPEELLTVADGPNITGIAIAYV